MSAKVMAIASALSLTLISPGLAQSQPPLQDTSGKGAIYCVLDLYVAAEASAKACRLPRQPVDDAIDEAVSRIEAFAVANSKAPVTAQQLRADAAAFDAALTGHLQRVYPGGLAGFCKSQDFQHAQSFRQQSPAKLKAFVDDLLSVPREPLTNPCI